MKNTSQLTNLQIELLKLFNFQASDKQLNDIKKLLSTYFAQNATQKIDQLWDENKWNEQTINDIKNEHLRTEYE